MGHDTINTVYVLTLFITTTVNFILFVDFFSVLINYTGYTLSRVRKPVHDLVEDYWGMQDGSSSLSN